MKYLFLLLATSVMSGCFVYSAEKDCIYGLTSTQCFGEEYTYVAEYQKPSSLGKTNPEIRWDDIVACGGKRGDVTLKSVWYRSNYNKQQTDQLWDKFSICMKNKGYIRIDYCGRKNSTTDKGICNE